MNWFGEFQYIHSNHIGNQCHGNYKTDPDTEKIDTVRELSKTPLPPNNHLKLDDTNVSGCNEHEEGDDEDDF